MNTNRVTLICPAWTFQPHKNNSITVAPERVSFYLDRGYKIA